MLLEVSTYKINNRKYLPMTYYIKILTLLMCISLSTNLFAQTDIRISGAQSGFPVAVPQMCDQGSGLSFAQKIPEVIARDLQISGLFKVLNPASFVETAGKCLTPEGPTYSDWSVVGAEGLVKGNIRSQDGNIKAELYLYDVLQQKAVIGKRYEGSEAEYAKIAHKFANEILFYFTGEKGVFGTQIAFVSSVGRFKELFIMDLDGSNVRQLTKDRGLVFSPSWSRDGTRLVYTSYASKTPDLYMTTVASGGSTRITKRPGLEIGAKFTPDGTGLVSSASFDGISKIVMFDLRGTVTKQLTRPSSIDVSPVYSPDGSQIAFCSNRGGGPQIYKMDADGSNPTRISFADSSYCTSPAWSPKGDKIVFVCRKAGFQLYMSGPDGGSPVQLTFSGDNEDPSWSPDGRFIAFSSTNLGGGKKAIGILSLLGGKPTRISQSKGIDSQPAWSPIVD